MKKTSHSKVDEDFFILLLLLFYLTDKHLLERIFFFFLGLLAIQILVQGHLGPVFIDNKSLTIRNALHDNKSKVA